MRDGGVVTVAGYAALRYRHVPRGTVALLRRRATARHARRARRPVRGSGHGSVGELRGGNGGVLSLPHRSRGAITARGSPAAHRFDRARRQGRRFVGGARGRRRRGRRRRLRQLDHPTDLAAACQAVENHVVGAPCGIMDQMTSACGQRDRLLRLRCQPGTIEGYVDIPDGYRCYGIDSGISHAVAGADYGTVRTAAFMGYRMIAAVAGLPAVRDGTRVRIDDPRWGGYLANLSAPELTELGGALPEEMSGAEFLERYDGLTDTATHVRPERRYPVRRATEHPVREHERVRRFAELLGVLADEPRAAFELGRLQSDC